MYPKNQVQSAGEELELVYLSAGTKGSGFCIRRSLPKAKVRGKMVVSKREVNGRDEKGANSYMNSTRRPRANIIFGGTIIGKS